jgi:hypothetical protein
MEIWKCDIFDGVEFGSLHQPRRGFKKRVGCISPHFVEVGGGKN